MASRYWSIGSNGVLVEIGQELRIEKREVKIIRRRLPVGA